ncbi:MAG: sigma-70 family RNA polymerase sigma factor, partial [Candidatus Binataceae bacterium]
RLRARNVRQRPRSDAGEVTEADDASVPIQHAQRREFVMTALNTLGENERAVLELAYYSDLSQTAIAEKTGLPLGTVKSRIRSALSKLREELKDSSS